MADLKLQIGIKNIFAKICLVPTEMSNKLNIKLFLFNWYTDLRCSVYRYLYHLCLKNVVFSKMYSSIYYLK